MDTPKDVLNPIKLTTSVSDHMTGVRVGSKATKHWYQLSDAVPGPLSVSVEEACLH